MVAELVDEGALVGFYPGQPAIAGEEGAGLLGLEPEGCSHIASAHDDPDAILTGVEGREDIPGGGPMEMESTGLQRLPCTEVWRPHAVNLRRLEVAPRSPLVEGDYSADGTLFLGRSGWLDVEAAAVLSVDLRALRRRLLCGFRRRLLGHLIAGIRRVHRYDVGQVDARQANHLVELDFALARPHIVQERLRVLVSIAVGHEDAPCVPGSLPIRV
mmetsp:Transcript_60844/g.144979  ORF Transcript_60844/g.144979 Transcript_60844/m.144979 type:complete len:215 (+) Transcript_60844:369-1013(+)